MVDLNDLVSPRSDVVLNDVTNIADSGEILINGLLPGCGDMDTCGHPYVLIPNGDCGEQCEHRITERQQAAAAQRARAQRLTIKRQPQLSPAERIRSMMRERFNVPGDSSVPRD